MKKFLKRLFFKIALLLTFVLMSTIVFLVLLINPIFGISLYIRQLTKIKNLLRKIQFYENNPTFDGNYYNSYHDDNVHTGK